ncbi:MULTISPECIES: hydrogen peroxide-inducible genes activator [unclassified Agarivorans]|uniref:hydrogen peroxide-inducible genes activator n=1 Tax=unclassified Agarivorans TaxID=2636026 RepID=UPI003D7EDFCC
MISLKQIHYALAIEQHLHFKNAADACAVSQSALSTAITDMERKLGFQVFERDNKKVLVTPLGKQLLEKARAISLQMGDIGKLVESTQNPLSTPMSIGVIPTIAPYLLPLVLPSLLETYPQLELTVIEDQSQQLVSEVTNGKLDAAILALPYPCQNLLHFPFWQEDFYWIAHKDNKMTTQATVRAKEMQQSNLMLLKEGHCLKDHVLSACNISSDAGHSLSGTSLNTLIELVVSKMGTTLLPQMALESLVQHRPSLASVRLDEKGPHREIAFVVRPNYPSVNNIERLGSFMHDKLTSHFQQHERC